MTVQNGTLSNLDRPFSEYAQPYLDCLERRERQLQAILRQSGFSKQVAADAIQHAHSVALGLIATRKVEDLGEQRWPYLIQVAITKGHDIRRNRWHRWVPIAPNAIVVDPFADDDSEEVRCDRYACVRSAFDRLSRRLRELFAYVYLEDHTYAEAVERFKIGLGVVSRRLKQARDLLRSELRALPLFSARAKAS